MLQVSPQMKILVATKPVDFRKGIDGLIGVCRVELEQDPFTGQLFIFRNRKGTALKVLAYDGQGFWLCQKRLSEGRFKHWPMSEHGVLALHPGQVQQLLWNENNSSKPAQWRPLH